MTGVFYNDLNGDGKRTNVAGGKNNEPGVSKAAFSVYVWLCIVLMHAAGALV